MSTSTQGARACGCAGALGVLGVPWVLGVLNTGTGYHFHTILLRTALDRLGEIIFIPKVTFFLRKSLVKHCIPSSQILGYN